MKEQTHSFLQLVLFFPILIFSIILSEYYEIPLVESQFASAISMLLFALPILLYFFIVLLWDKLLERKGVKF